MVKEGYKSSEPSLTGVKKKVVGYLSALSVSICAVFVIVSGQLIGDSIPPFQTNFVRFVVQTVIAVGGLIVTRTNPQLPLAWTPVLVMTSSVILNFGAGVLFVVSSWYLPAALVQGLLESCIITLSGILAIFRKKCTIDLPFAILFCYIGCLLMIQPFGIFGSDTVAMDNHDTRNSSFNSTCPLSNSSQGSCESSQSLETLYGFLSVIGLAVCFWIHAQFNVEYLIQWTSITSILFWFGIGCAVLSLPILGFLRQPIVAPSVGQMGLELLFGIAFTGNVFFIMYAVTLIPLSHVAILFPSGLIFLYIFQKTLLKNIQPGPDNWIAILGLILILAGTLLTPTCDIIREKNRLKNKDCNQKENNDPETNVNENTLKLRDIAQFLLPNKGDVDITRTTN